MAQNLVCKLFSCGLIVSSVSLIILPVKAQIIELGDNIRINTSNDRYRRSRTNVRISGDNGRLNVGLEEQRRPQTRIRIFDRNGSPSLDIREERPAPEERVRLSLPF